MTSKFQPDPVADDDTEGHKMYSDEGLKEDIEPVADDDTEGHVKVARALPEETDDDTEGHRM